MNTTQDHCSKRKEFIIEGYEVTLEWLISTKAGYSIRLHSTHTKTQEFFEKNWSFGTSDSIEDVSFQWGEYLAFILGEMKTKEQVEELIHDMELIDCQTPIYTDLDIIEDMVYGHLYLTEFKKLPASTSDKPRVVAVMGSGVPVRFFSDIDFDVEVVTYVSGQETVELLSAPLFGEEAIHHGKIEVSANSEAVDRYVGGLSIAQKIMEKRKRPKVEISGAAYMVPLYDGLTVSEMQELFTYLTHIKQMVPIEIYQNNTAIIGFKNEKVIDDVEIMNSLRAIAEDWELHSADNIVTTRSGQRIVLLERVIPHKAHSEVLSPL